MSTPTRVSGHRISIPDAAMHPKLAAELFERNGFAGVYTRAASQRAWNAVGYGLARKPRKRRHR